ncbi:glycosyltransferase family 2 protein [Polymorphospora sp. NPDC050346]|uniref:glycosyltransferase family 2 protein n=1 Tax=Polymorphospora sp. NPDC050346 TaxID=3155780 RepID=UPI0033FB1E4E
MNSGRILIIIPAWNESGSIADVVTEVRGELPDVDILVVDDGSTDATSVRAAAAGARVVRLPYNLGVGGAMRLGYRYARDHGYDVAVQLDADGQHDPRFVPELVAALADVDLVIGARFAGVGDYTVRGPRRYAMVLLAAALSRIARTRLTDTTSGFRAANRRVIEMFARAYPVEYLGDTVETVVHVAKTGLRIVQVPVAMRARMAGVPSQSVGKAALYLARAAVVLGLALIRRYEAPPDPAAPVGAGPAVPAAGTAEVPAATARSVAG